MGVVDGGENLREELIRKCFWKSYFQYYESPSCELRFI